MFLIINDNDEDHRNDNSDDYVLDDDFDDGGEEVDNGDVYANGIDDFDDSAQR